MDTESGDNFTRYFLECSEVLFWGVILESTLRILITRFLLEEVVK